MAILIVGQGVAGTMLALELEQRGVDIHIIDKGVNHSSEIAAGIINPLVFRRTTLAWGLEQSWDLCRATYRALEEKLDQSFFHTKPMRRLFASEQEAKLWKVKCQEEAFKKHIGYCDSHEQLEYAQNTFGQGKIHEAHHIDVRSFLNETRAYFVAQGKLTEREINYRDIEKQLSKGEWQGVVFCQGFENIYNPYFNFLPIYTTKGEILTVHSPRISQDELLNRKCFLLPITNGNFRVGSTYQWATTNLNTTEEARDEILGNLNTLINVSVDLVDQQAGIRPTTPDRRPILGAHPNNPNLYILNGLGTRGYLLAPWCAQVLADFIIEQKEIPREMNLNRFLK